MLSTNLLHLAHTTYFFIHGGISGKMAKAFIAANANSTLVSQRDLLEEKMKHNYELHITNSKLCTTVMRVYYYDTIYNMCYIKQTIILGRLSIIMV